MVIDNIQVRAQKLFKQTFYRLEADEFHQPGTYLKLKGKKSLPALNVSDVDESEPDTLWRPAYTFIAFIASFPVF